MVTVRSYRSGTDFTVHRDVAPILKHIIDEVERRDYLLDHGRADVDDDWSFVNRPIGGTDEPSYHSWGLAVDIDAQEYPWGSYRRLPQWVVDLFGAYRWEYGGDWSGKKDPMHFQFEGTPAQARWIVASLAAEVTQGGRPPVPQTVPPPAVPKEDDMYFVITDDPPARKRKFAASPSAGWYENLTEEQWLARAFLAGAVAQKCTALEFMVFVDRLGLRDVTKAVLR